MFTTASSKTLSNLLSHLILSLDDTDIFTKPSISQHFYQTFFFTIVYALFPCVKIDLFTSGANMIVCERVITGF